MGEEKIGVNRRKFLGASLACTLGAGLMGLSPQLTNAQEVLPGSSGKKIITRKFGKIGWEIPIVSMGEGAATSPQIIQVAYEMGLRHFDTAANYQYGRNEQIIGNVISKMGVRDKVILSTKIFTPQQRQATPDNQYKNKIIPLVDGSLKRMKSDYIDILYLHEVSNPSEVSNPAIFEAFQMIKSQGKARAIGWATHANMAAIIRAATAAGYDAILTAFNFTMADDSELLEAIAAAARAGVGIVAMKTMAGGSQWPNPESRRNYDSRTVAKACLKWVMNNENIHTSIPGFGNFDHLREDFEVAYNLEYTPEEKDLLSDNNIRLSLGFCRQCRQCLATCPNNAEIPTLMRTYMYSAQYADFYLARRTLWEIPSGQGLEACGSCAACLAKCDHGVNIAHKISELKLMYI